MGSIANGTHRIVEPVIDVPVVIVGGGGCGLTTSIFLSDHGVEHFLFEKHPGTSRLPRAHYINQRSMEVFRQHNVAEHIKATSCPTGNLSRTDWRTPPGGNGPFDNRLLATMPAFGGQLGTPEGETYRKDGPELSTNLPLIRLEPVFRQVAEERNPGRILFSHSVQHISEQSDGVIVTVKASDGSIATYRAQYLIGADGGKLVGPQMGVEMEGPANIVKFASAYVRADLSKYCGDGTLITHYVNPDPEGEFDHGTLIKMGPTWNRHSEEWVFHYDYPVSDRTYTAEDLLPQIRQLLKAPELEVEILEVSHWILERRLATKYSQGRLFIAGDAAHRRPPLTGLGLNTAIEDAHNLTWKLALVLHGRAKPPLLDTYDAERRPIGRRNCDWAYHAYNNTFVLNAALGLAPGQRANNQERLSRLFEDSPQGETARYHLQRVFNTQDVEFSAHNIELGFVYSSGAVVPDGTTAPREDPGGKIYVPTTRPGHRLPHAWIERGGKTISTHDLIGSGKQHDLVLITDEAGNEWIKAADALTKKYGLRIGTAAIGAHPQSTHSDLYQNCDGVWAKVRGITDGGAILVRPDNFVIWRSLGPSMSNYTDLERDLKKVFI
ncbi:FAD binding domain-containing protein [Aspergillus caelatus]|uniref:FAD binding domain-containing protein n=1 Tax=Aspergillus caelatus TaxID=61420 RepID=A0A5N7A9F9_9EURO|nr:FAD binding domain-containing protein [Aspergillus caelatus]KAE8366462.1 FAD binding domain-containing protein [Aspergillus caelatus]